MYALSSSPQPNLKRISKATLFLLSFINTMTTSATAFSVSVHGSGVPSVNQTYEWKTHDIIPKGFASVCIKNQWNVQLTWDKLNGQRLWLHAENDAYIYLNSMDNHWWIDEPNGNGVYIALELQSLSTCTADNMFAPPTTGWRSLVGGGTGALPNIEINQ